MISFTKKKLYELMPLALLFVALFVFTYNFYEYGDQQFSDLANSFLHYKLYFLDSSYYNQHLIDNVFFNNHYYWPLGPFPAVVLMPFVWLGNIFKFYFFQGNLNFFLVILLSYLIFKLARKINFSITDSTYWCVAFIFSSMFLSIAMISSSWYFAHTITVLLLFLALLENFGKKRYFLIGLVLGLVLLTRLTAFIGILFFVFDILLEKNYNWPEKIKNILKLALIPIICLILLLTYNYARFNNPLDQGYRAQILQSAFMVDKNHYGLFNLKYLPRGLYYSLISMPKPVLESDSRLLKFPFVKADPWGMSIFLTSPYLIYLFFIKIKNKAAIKLLLTSAIIWLIISASFFIGWTQFGFRYALDFMPLLFVAFMMIYKDHKEKISTSLKTIIILSAIFNLYLLYVTFLSSL